MFNNIDQTHPRIIYVYWQTLKYKKNRTDSLHGDSFFGGNYIYMYIQRDGCPNIEGWFTSAFIILKIDIKVVYYVPLPLWNG